MKRSQSQGPGLGAGRAGSSKDAAPGRAGADRASPVTGAAGDPEKKGGDSGRKGRPWPAIVPLPILGLQPLPLPASGGARSPGGQGRDTARFRTSWRPACSGASGRSGRWA